MKFIKICKISIYSKQIKNRKKKVLLAWIGSCHNLSLFTFIELTLLFSPSVDLIDYYSKYLNQHWLTACQCFAWDFLQQTVSRYYQASSEWFDKRLGNVGMLWRKNLVNQIPALVKHNIWLERRHRHIQRGALGCCRTVVRAPLRRCLVKNLPFTHIVNRSCTHNASGLDLTFYAYSE